MNTTMLAEELGQLQERIEQARQRQEALEGQLRAVNADLETFSAERQRFDALRDVCNALDKLGELKADALFWEGVQNAPGLLEQARSRLARFEGEIGGKLDRQAALQEQINRCLDELYFLNEEVRDAYAREERRQEEYAIERDISEVPNRSMVMPWSKEAESERRFHKALRAAFAFYVVFALIILLWKLPPPVRPVVAVVPERLVSMLRKEPPRPEPQPNRRKEEKKPEHEQKAAEKQQEEKPVVTAAETQAARKKAESSGVLAFKDSFKDIMEETPAARLGTEARLNNQSASAGQARPSRSLVAMPAGSGSSGGISNAGVSRNIGSGNGNRIGGVGFSRVESSVAGLAEGTRPLSTGPGPARTDEEIQIVFDKYKAALYRLYNAELRKNPTLRGKMILRLTIEPGGEVSLCVVQSSDLASQELVAQIVERVRKFNFGPKQEVPKTTILYPIDFLPGG